jgi:hypothetical protein
MTRLRCRAALGLKLPLFRRKRSFSPARLKSHRSRSLKKYVVRSSMALHSKSPNLTLKLLSSQHAPGRDWIMDRLMPHTPCHITLVYGVNAQRSVAPHSTFVKSGCRTCRALTEELAGFGSWQTGEHIHMFKNRNPLAVSVKVSSQFMSTSLNQSERHNICLSLCLISIAP